MEEEKWTVVGRRRSARTHRQPSRRRSGAGVAPFPQAEEGDEGLLLLRLKRSIARVHESAFFQRLLLQVHSGPVCDLLSKAASTSCSQRIHQLQDDDAVEHDNEHKLPRDELPDELAAMFAHENSHGNRDVSQPMRSSTAEARAENCTRTSSLYASKIEACERSQNISESYGLIVSTKSLNDTNFITLECKSTIDSCRNSCATDAECTCKTIDLQACKEHWHLDVVLYGLGSIADSEISRCQLALILLLKQRLSWVGVIEVYDPVLTHSERQVIKELGCLPVTSDEKGKRSVTGPTLFYMPHCEDWLYDNVLQANWVPCTLRQIVILGNSFQDYQERWASPVGRKSTPPSYVLQYQQIAKEIPLEATCSDLPGFNNMSWHFYEL